LFNNSVNTLKAKLKGNIEILRNKELSKKEKMNPKVKQSVLGHRNFYATKTEQLITNIPIFEKDYLSDHLVDLENELDQFGKTTQKSYFATQHLFFNEVKNIAHDISSISDKHNELKSFLEKNNLEGIEDIQNKIKEINKKIKLKEQLTSVLNAKKLELITANKAQKQQHEKLDDIKNKKGYKFYKELVKKLDDSDITLRRIKDQVYFQFFEIERVLKKFEHISEDEKILRNYINDPVNSLIEDEELKISPIIENIKERIDELGLKEKKEEKALDSLDKLNHNYLKKTSDWLRQLQQDKKEKERTLKLDLIYLELEGEKKRLERIISKVKLTEEEIEKLREKINEINLRQDKLGLQNIISKKFDLGVVIE